MGTLDKMQFQNLLIQLAEQGASDLYLTVGKPPLLKIVNELRPANDQVLTTSKIEELVLPLLNKDQQKKLKEKMSLLFGHTFESGLRFKINIFYQKNFLAADFHFISPHIETLRNLGLPAQLEKIVYWEKGLVVITGPYKSGKTTTAVSLLEHVNQTRQEKIVSLEEPTEIIMTGKKSVIQQREVGADTPSLKVGLEDCLNTSAEVIMVEGVRNKEEMELVLNLTDQGRLVLLLLDANSVLDAVTKIFAYFSDSERKRIQEVFARAIKAILCQKLIVDAANNYLVVPEILFTSEAVKLSIADGKLNQVNNIIRTSANQGMVTFEQSMAKLVRAGKISHEKALNNIEDKQAFKSLIE